MRLSTQLSSSLLVFLILVFAGSFIINVKLTREYVNEQLATHAQDTATSLGLSVTPYLGDANGLIVAETMEPPDAKAQQPRAEVTMLVNAQRVCKRGSNREYARLGNAPRAVTVTATTIAKSSASTGAMEGKLRNGERCGGKQRAR